MISCYDCGGEGCTSCVGGYRISKRLGLAAGLALIASIAQSATSGSGVSQVTFERQSRPVAQSIAACAGPSLVGTLNCLISSADEP